MLKYEEYLAESLAAEVKTEPKTAASREARKLGLTYMGFGRYADNTGKIAYLVHDDRLVPYKDRGQVNAMNYNAAAAAAKAPTMKKSLSASQKMDKTSQSKQEAEFYNTVLNKRDKEDSNILKQKDKEAQALSNELYKFYSPGMFDENEVNAIQEYTMEAYDEINSYLYKGHDEGVTPEQDQYINNLINALDSAFEETEAPFPYTVYSGLSSRYTADKIKPGSEYIFRGYLSTSISYGTAIDGFTESDWNDNPVVLQIEISRGQKSIYVDPVSEHQGEGETLLPRGSKIKIVSGPHVIHDSIVSENPIGNKINLFHCVIVED